MQTAEPATSHQADGRLHSESTTVAPAAGVGVAPVDGLDVEVVSRSTVSAEQVAVSLARQIDDFAVDWPMLADPKSALCHAFQTRDFIETWEKTIGRARGSELAFIRVGEPGQAGRPLMLLAFEIETKKGVRVLRFVDADVSDYNAPVVFPWTPDWSKADCLMLWNRILKTLPAVDVLSLEKMPLDVLGAPNPMTALPTKPWPVSCHRANLHDTWESFAEDRVRQSKTHRRYQRGLRRDHDVQYTGSENMDDAQIAATLEVLFEQKARRFRETRVPGFEPGDGKHDFYSTMALASGTRANVHVSIIKADDSAMATQWGIKFDDRYYYLICGHDVERWAKLSPGRMINEGMLKWCHEQGLKVADFGIGDEVYKFEFCDQHPVLCSHLSGLTVKGKAFVVGVETLKKMRQLTIWQKVRPYKWVVLRALQRK
ncbi:MAG: GNAT family N-acetyltransferase [Pseudomonadota bacterium]